MRLEMREIKLKLEKIVDDLSLKSNIKDVCALVDLKANAEDLEKSLE